jgi:hypothetical protein
MGTSPIRLPGPDAFTGVVARYGLEVVLAVARGLSDGESLARLRGELALSKRAVRRIRAAVGQPVTVWTPRPALVALARGPVLRETEGQSKSTAARASSPRRMPPPEPVSGSCPLEVVEGR